ncbi:MAG: gamma-glutamyltransferase [Bryobacteraceae bacterium]|nr:gamma-glutamyltransferase [Bryobacteraceae bacterium]
MLRVASINSALLALAAALCASAASAPAVGLGGMVSAAHPLATEVGVSILEKDGNAFDAAVAVAAALNVVEPQNSGAGGFGIILIYNAAARQVRVLNASGRIPKSAAPDLFRPPTPDYLENRRGPKTITAPVNVRAWEELSKRYGRLAWATLFEPAIRLAGEGFILPAPIDAEAFQRFPDHARRIYGKDGRPLRAGERLVQKDLAASLRLIADEGPSALHGGRLGKLIDAELRRAGSFVRLDDIASSKAEWWQPIDIDYRGYRVVTASPPANSFTALIRMGILSQWDLRSPGAGSADYLHRFAEVTQHAEWCRLRYAADPDIERPPLDHLLSAAYWKEQAGRVDPRRASEFVSPWSAANDSPNTTHFVVADRHGNIVSATQTIGNTFGARVMAPGTGIWLNDSLYYCTFEPKGNPMDVHPGRRKLNSNTPTFVLKDGRPWIAIGAAGGHTIPQTVPQVLIDMIDFGMDIQAALAAPRIAFVSLDNILQVEDSVPAAVRDELAARGRKLSVVPSIGRLHGLAITYDDQGRPARFQGGADPRGAGLAKGSD